MIEKPRILIVDDHPMVRKGLLTVLQSAPGCRVCGEAANGREAVALAERLRPDIVIMDLTMPELSGLEATRRILRDNPDCRVLILTMHESEQLMHEVLEAGARGYMLKSDAGNTIHRAIDNLCRDRPFFTDRMSGVLLRAYLQPPDRSGVGDRNELTPREREVVHHIAEGRTTREIAERLGISEKTAETHRANLMRKLQVHSVSEIVRYAIRNQMIEP